jgi:hypothetical protein
MICDAHGRTQARASLASRRSATHVVNDPTMLSADTPTPCAAGATEFCTLTGGRP